MREYKFRVKDEQHSRNIQSALFELGYKWACNPPGEFDFVDKPFLFCEADGSITFAGPRDGNFFESVQCEEADVQVSYTIVPAPIPTVEVNGKHYKLSDIEKLEEVK